MIPSWFFISFATVFGLSLGSFLNVLIVRLPLDKSIKGRSQCPKCEKTISWYDNIPVISYLILGGKCRACSKEISIEYPIVELVTAVLAVLTIYRTDFSMPPFFLWFLLFMCPLVVITFIDFKLWIIPDILSKPGVISGFLVNLYLQWPHWKEALLFSLLGMLAGGGILWIIAVLYEKIRKQEGLGLGDVYLCALLGSFLGWQSIPFIFFTSSILGLLYAVVSLIFSGKKEEGPMKIPFGPFLSAAGIIYFFYGKQLISLYFKALGL